VAMVAHLETVARAVTGTRWAIVTVAPASYGMMRMLSVRAEKIPMTVRIFDDPDEAESWLLRDAEA